MKVKTTFRLLAAFVALALFAAVCGSDDDDKAGGDDSDGATATSAPADSEPAADFAALGGWSDEACSDADPKVVVGISAPIDTAGLSLKDYVDGAEAAVDAFNGRGGISGRCLELKVCDGKGDGPTELSCAREQTEDADMVATLASTFTQSEAEAYQLFAGAGLAEVGAQVTQPGAWNSPVSFEFTMGGSGTLLGGMAALKSIGVEKFVVFLPESGQTAALKAFAAPLVTALGMELVEIIGIPPTAVEFTQFVTTAQNTGVEGAVLGLPGNVATQIIDAMDSLSSELKLSVSWGTFSQKGVTDVPEEIQGNMAFTDAVPPVVSTAPPPIYDVVIDDFSASDEASLERENITAQSINAWLATYALVKVMRDSGATEITRATVKEAFDAATDVPMFDLIPPWTPAKQSTNRIFTGISNPNYWTGHWDTGEKVFVVDPEQVDILALLG